MSVSSEGTRDRVHVDSSRTPLRNTRDFLRIVSLLPYVSIATVILTSGGSGPWVFVHLLGWAGCIVWFVRPRGYRAIAFLTYWLQRQDGSMWGWRHDIEMGWETIVDRSGVIPSRARVLDGGEQSSGVVGFLWRTVQRNLRRWSKTPDIPAVQSVAPSSFGAVVTIRLSLGVTVEDFERAKPALLDALGVPSMAVVRVAPSVVELRCRTIDPLSSVEHLDFGAVAELGGDPQPVGRDEDGVPVRLDLHGAPWHVAIQGASRSGKSALVYALLASVSVQAQHGRMVLAGVDPTGILFKPFAGYPGEQLRASGLSDETAISEVVRGLVAEMENRIDALLRSGRDKLTGGREIPTILAVFEEYPGLLAHLEEIDKPLKPAERIGPSFRLGVRRLIQEGAKVGIRVLVIAQRMDASIIGGSERSNIGTRISLRVDNADAVRMLHETGSGEDIVQRVRAFQPGQALIEVAGEQPRYFRSLLTDYGPWAEFVGGAR